MAGSGSQGYCWCLSEMLFHFSFAFSQARNRPDTLIRHPLRMTHPNILSHPRVTIFGHPRSAVCYNWLVTAHNDAYELSPAEKVGKVYDTLATYYGDLEWRASTDPLSELILTILSQHTSDLNRDRAFDSMRSHFPTWEEVRDA